MYTYAKNSHARSGAEPPAHHNQVAWHGPAGHVGRLLGKVHAAAIEVAVTRAPRVKADGAAVDDRGVQLARAVKQPDKRPVQQGS